MNKPSRKIEADKPPTDVSLAPMPGYSKARKLLDSEIAISKVMDFLTRTQDADEMLAKAGIKRHQLRQLEMDDEVSQCLETRKDAICAVAWRLEPNQTLESLYVKSVLEEHVERLISDIMDAVPYGYSVMEAVYKLDGNRVRLARILQKPMEWFEPKPDGTMRFYPEDGTGGIEGLPCDPRKFFLSVRRPRYQNPRGEALLSRLWFPITWRREGWFMWLHFLETFGDPIVLGQVPDFRSFVDAMRAQGVRSTIAWQSTSDRDNVSTINASTPGEFERLEHAIVRRVQKLLLGQTMTSDVSNYGGSYAQAAVHNQVRHDKTKSDSRMVYRVIQRIIDVLCDLNGFAPLKFVLADDAGLEAARAARDALIWPVIRESGFTITKGYFTDTYDYRADDLALVVPDPNAPVVPPNATNAPDGTQIPDSKTVPTRGRSVIDNPGVPIEDNSKRVGAPTVAEKGFAFADPGITPMQDAADRLAAQAIAAIQNQVGWAINGEALQAAIQQATDRADLERRLAGLFPDALGESEFRNVLAAADFAARAIGYVGATTGLA